MVAASYSDALASSQFIQLDEGEFMRRLFNVTTKAVLCVVFLCCALSGFAQKITVDPNAAPRLTTQEKEDKAKTMAQYAKSDTRLTQKITYEARLQSVQQIIADLCEMTGVELIAGARNSDWPVRSRKMNIFIKDVPLYELMDSIARVMRFQWRRSEDDKPMTYRLIVNGKAAAEADAMMKRAEKMQEEIWQQRRKEWADVIEKYGAKSASELISLRETDPQIYEQAFLGSLQAVHALFKEVPETKDRFLAGKNFRISADQLNPETKSLCFNAGNEFWKHLQRIGYGMPKTQNPPGYENVLYESDHFDIAYKRLDVGTFTPNLRWGSASMSDTGYWHLMKKDRDFEINGFRYLGTEWNRGISVANIKKNEGVDVNEAHASPASVAAALNAFFEDRKKLEESLYPSEPLVEHAEFPQLEREITLKIDEPKPDENWLLRLSNKIASIQKALSEASGLGVVSDCWKCLPLSGNLPALDGSKKMDELLEMFSSKLNYNWNKPDSILEFRYRKWAKMRLNQIPDDWVSTWSNNTKNNGYLSLSDLASISNITYDQVIESIHDPVIAGTSVCKSMFDILDDNLPWLRFYSSLKPQQIELLTGQFGLNGHMLTSEQWKLAQPMFDRIGMTRGEVLMRMESTSNKEQKEYISRFEEIDLGSHMVDRKWSIRHPIYDPPKSETTPKSETMSKSEPTTKSETTTRQ